MRTFFASMFLSMQVVFSVAMLEEACAIENDVPRQVYIDVPKDVRTPNYWGPRMSGSCVHAATANLLKWVGLDDWSSWWLKNFAGGETASGLIQKLEKSGLPYAYTSTGNIKFLEWATRNRYGAGIFYFRRHAVNLVGLDKKYAYILDNNDPSVIIAIRRNVFEDEWKHKYGGFAWVIVNSPSPPYPKQ